MESIQHLPDHVGQICHRNIYLAKETLGFPPIEDSLIIEALISAHRDKFDGYANDGNRQLASSGANGLESCIRCCPPLLYTEEEVLEKRRRLRTIDGLLEVAFKTPLRMCIIPSIRQSNTVVERPIPKRVVTYLVRALIGAVYLGSNRNLEVTADAIDNLCRCFDSGQPSDTAHAQASCHLPPGSRESYPMSDENTLAQIPDRQIENPLADSACDWDFSPPLYEESYELQRSTEDGLDYLHWPTDQGSFVTDNLDIGHGTQPIIESNAVIDECLSGMSYQLENVTLAHASEGVQQYFVRTIVQPLEGPSKSSHETSTTITVIPANRSGPKKRKSITQRPTIGRYVEEQLRKATIQGNIPSPLREEYHPTGKQPAHNKTMQKLWHATASSFAVCRIKAALEAYRSASSLADSQSRLHDSVNPDLPSTPIFHYLEITHLRNSGFKGGIKTLFHLHGFYKTLSQGFVADYHEGFVNDGPAYMERTVDPEVRKRAGNRLKARLSNAYVDMIRKFDRNFDSRSEVEQNRLKTFFERLRQWGVHLEKLVTTFGPGVLCLLPIENATSDQERFLTVTEPEFCKLPGINLDELLRQMTQKGHAIKLLAAAAEAVLNRLVDSSTDDVIRFRCEDTEEAQILELVEGSDELISQLQIV